MLLGKATANQSQPSRTALNKISAVPVQDSAANISCSVPGQRWIKYQLFRSRTALNQISVVPVPDSAKSNISCSSTGPRWIKNKLFRCRTAPNQISDVPVPDSAEPNICFPVPDSAEPNIRCSSANLFVTKWKIVIYSTHLHVIISVILLINCRQCWGN